MLALLVLFLLLPFISMFNLSNFGPLDLVILQTTSFCNLDCDYCYLPDRHLKNQFSLDLIEPVFRRIFESPFVGVCFTVCWHAGEPLAVPISFYETALAQIEELDKTLNKTGCEIGQSVQTNATLITPAWCDLFKRYNLQVGVSIDGPDFIHDAHRKTRTGLGTHHSTMRGIRHLQEQDVPFNIITVITEDSLDYADEMFAFFMDHGLTDVGFNIEELEGVNQSSSLANAEARKRYKAFIQRFWDLTTQSGGAFKLREFERICSLIYNGDRIPRSGLTTPFVILNVDHQGNFSTFDPELLAINTAEYGDFILGNVLTDSLESVCQSEKFQRIYGDITAGVELCQQTCQYYGICGGGSASNKYWENGTFRSSQTMACQYYEQMMTDLVVERLEETLGLTHV